MIVDVPGCTFISYRMDVALGAVTLELTFRRNSMNTVSCNVITPMNPEELNVLYTFLGYTVNRVVLSQQCMSMTFIDSEEMLVIRRKKE